MCVYKYIFSYLKVQKLFLAVLLLTCNNLQNNIFIRKKNY